MYLMKVKCTFDRSVLGSLPTDEDLMRSYIASKAPDASTVEDEIKATSVDEVADGKITVFPRNDDGIPFIYDYQFRGFLKAAVSALNKVPGTRASKVKAFKKKIDQHVFVVDRENLIHFPEDAMTVCSRPLRASTPQGDRVAIASSEEIPDGAWFNVTLKMFLKDDVDLMKEAMKYGAYNGLGQWRNSGHGIFHYEIEEEWEEEF